MAKGKESKEVQEVKEEVTENALQDEKEQEKEKKEVKGGDEPWQELNRKLDSINQALSNFLKILEPKQEEQEKIVQIPVPPKKEEEDKKEEQKPKRSLWDLLW